MSAQVADMSVLIVDDQAPFRLAAAAVVAATGGFRLVATAVSGEEALDVAQRLAPDLVLMDVQLPGIDGWEATRLLTALPAPPLVLVLSGADVADAAERVVASGALDYLPKSAFGPGHLIRAGAAARTGPGAPRPGPGN